MSDPYNIAIITGSPSKPSKTAGLGILAEQRLAQHGFRSRTIHVRDLPAQAVLHARTDEKELAAALSAVEEADGVIVATPTYKASYTGVLKAFLDLLPQFGLRGKVALPLLTGGSLAHVLALDYGLRPVLQSLDPKHTATGLFLLDKWITLGDDGSVALDPEAAPRFDQVIRSFVDGVRALVTEE